MEQGQDQAPQVEDQAQQLSLLHVSSVEAFANHQKIQEINSVMKAHSIIWYLESRFFKR